MGDTEHLKVALHETVFSRGAVLHYICIVKLHLLPCHCHGKVVLVDGRALSFGNDHPHGVLLPVCGKGPQAEAGEDFIYIELCSVDPGGGELAASA